MRPKKIGGYDDAVIGHMTLDNGQVVILYDQDELIASIMRQQDLDYDEALEHLDFNIIGSLGHAEEGWPLIMTSATLEEIEAMVDAND